MTEEEKELMLKYLEEQKFEWDFAAGELRVGGPSNGIWDDKWEKEVELLELNVELVKEQIRQLLSE
ncbi:MAG: hypothetical protein Crog4KO_36450 [Crocinitomicaceae bacterium]